MSTRPQEQQGTFLDVGARIASSERVDACAIVDLAEWVAKIGLEMGRP